MERQRSFSAFRFIHKGHHDESFSSDEVINVRGRYDAIRRMGSKEEQKSPIPNDPWDYRDGRGKGGKLLFDKVFTKEHTASS